mgnify:CR=1 FL=1
MNVSKKAIIGKNVVIADTAKIFDNVYIEDKRGTAVSKKGSI